MVLILQPLLRSSVTEHNIANIQPTAFLNLLYLDGDLSVTPLRGSAVGITGTNDIQAIFFLGP